LKRWKALQSGLINYLLAAHILPDSLCELIASARQQRHHERLLQCGKKTAQDILNRHEPVMLEIGSGEKKGRDGWTTLDIVPGCDMYWDLHRPFPFPANSVDTIYSSHVLEHFSYYELINLLKECLRVLKPHGSFSVSVPNAGIYIKAYCCNSEQFEPEKFCCYKPALLGNSRIDYVNYIAYMGDLHRYMFDEKNLVVLLEYVGFRNAHLRDFDCMLDHPDRQYESIYAEAEK
jgi:predicted SAM-dependent methyltransferase